ncbi:hypothetical protein V1227_18900 [Lentzea sp. DG1S-22]|uniref:hypothetical protein n=1 Tax=Lentzea sp. DG1S-22 TaxID=3108822 RepID=UPI002E79C7AE|nr:hypothetical protein [Lentzea sp. DG1S-22]WVH84716.1 hypothetical protein V1227_18900 [Lentzea sp. DG1S-22]
MGFEDDVARIKAQKSEASARATDSRARQDAEYARSMQEWKQVLADAAAYLSARVRPTQIVLERRALRSDIYSPAGFVLHRQPVLYGYRQLPVNSAKYNNDEVHLLLPSGQLLLIVAQDVKGPIDPPKQDYFSGAAHLLQLEVRAVRGSLEARHIRSDGPWTSFRDCVAERCIAALENHDPLSSSHG